jgi:hypothetical protein
MEEMKPIATLVFAKGTVTDEDLKVIVDAHAANGMTLVPLPFLVPESQVIVPFITKY